MGFDMYQSYRIDLICSWTGQDQVGFIAGVIINRSQFPTLRLASAENGLRVIMPIISAGSFGDACDGASNLQRLLPPARKITDFFINFWEQADELKPVWEQAYVYKKKHNTEDCFWWVV